LFPPVISQRLFGFGLLCLPKICLLIYGELSPDAFLIRNNSKLDNLFIYIIVSFLIVFLLQRHNPFTLFPPKLPRPLFNSDHLLISLLGEAVPNKRVMCRRTTPTGAHGNHPKFFFPPRQDLIRSQWDRRSTTAIPHLLPGFLHR